MKGYLEFSVSQKKIFNMAIFSVENGEKQEVDFENSVDEFASIKTRGVHFPLCFRH